MKQSTRDILRSSNTARAFSDIHTFFSVWETAHMMRMQSWPETAKPFIESMVLVLEKECLKHFEGAFTAMSELREGIKEDLEYYTPKPERS